MEETPREDIAENLVDVEETPQEVQKALMENPEIWDLQIHGTYHFETEGMTTEERGELARDIMNSIEISGSSLNIVWEEVSQETGEALRTATDAFKYSIRAITEAFKEFYGVTDSDGESIEQQISRNLQEARQIVAQRTEADAKIEPLLSSDAWKEIEKLYPDAEECLHTARVVDPVFTLEVMNKIPDLLPEFRDYAAQNKGARLAAILEGEFADADENGEYHSVFRDFLHHAEERKHEQEETAPEAENYHAAERPQKLFKGADKVSNSLWAIPREQIGEVQKIRVDSRKDREAGKPPVITYFSLDFEEAEKAGIQITKEIGPYDRRVHDAYYSLCKSGAQMITLDQLYYAMGNDGIPGKSDRGKIEKSMDKMGAARFILDNKEESARYKKYTYPRISGPLLPFLKLEEVRMNGNPVRVAFQPLTVPPLAAFAESRKQMIAIPRETLMIPLSQTPANLRLDDYLTDRIAKLKNSKGSQQPRMLFKTIYERIGATSRTQRFRTRDKIKILMDHYKATGFIQDYAMDEDGITVKARK